MNNFLLIVVFAVIGFTMVFFQYSTPGVTFRDYLEYQYSYLFANGQQPDGTTVSDYIFYAMIALFLSLIMKNMLITIMNDTYIRVDSSLIIVDTQEKIALITEYAAVQHQIKKMYHWFIKKSQDDQKTLPKKVLLVVEEYGQDGSRVATEAGRLAIIEKKFDKLVNVIIPNFYEKFREQIEQFEFKLYENTRQIRAWNQEVAKSFSSLHVLKQLSKLEDLSKLENLPRFDRLEKLSKLEKLEKIDRIDKIDKIINTNIVEKLQKLNSLERLEGLDTLEDLRLLNRLKRLDELSELDNLVKLNQLEKLNGLSKLNKLDKMNELFRLDPLLRLEKLGILDSLQKVNSLSKLDNLSKLDKLNLLESLVNSKKFKNLDLLENLKEADLKEIALSIDSLDRLETKLERSLQQSSLENQQWKTLGMKLSQLDRLEPLTRLPSIMKNDPAENLGAIEKIGSKLESIITRVNSGNFDLSEMSSMKSIPKLKSVKSKPRTETNKSVKEVEPSSENPQKVKVEEEQKVQKTQPMQLSNKKTNINPVPKSQPDKISNVSGLEDALKFFIHAKSQVEKLSVKEFYELKAFKIPPKPIYDLMETITIILQNQKTNFEWGDAKKLFSDFRFSERLNSFDFSVLNNEVMSHLENYLVGYPTNDIVSKSSLLGSPLHDWVRSIYYLKKYSQETKGDQPEIAMKTP